MKNSYKSLNAKLVAMISMVILFLFMHISGSAEGIVNSYEYFKGDTILIRVLDLKLYTENETQLEVYYGKKDNYSGFNESEAKKSLIFRGVKGKLHYMEFDSGKTNYILTDTYFMINDKSFNLPIEEGAIEFNMYSEFRKFAESEYGKYFGIISKKVAEFVRLASIDIDIAKKQKSMLVLKDEATILPNKEDLKLFKLSSPVFRFYLDGEYCLGVNNDNRKYLEEVFFISNKYLSYSECQSPLKIAAKDINYGVYKLATQSLWRKVSLVKPILVSELERQEKKREDYSRNEKLESLKNDLKF